MPYNLLDKYEQIINHTIDIMKNRTDISLEIILPSLFENKYIVETIGCEGIIAIDESYNVYKV